MKRLHIHIAVNKLSESINFYSAIFNTSPSVEHADYAKWDLLEPAVNFAISERGHTSGINHLGIQVDSDDELEELATRLDTAEIALSKEEGASCCYAQSNKYWVIDPQGIAWESFHTLGQITTFGKDTNTNAENHSSTCCIPLKNNESDVTKSAACCVPEETE